MSLNKIVLLGRITAEPELKTTQSGASVIGFTLAVDRDFKSKDGDRECDFIPCTAWRGTAEFIAKYFTKGSSAAVAGSLQSRHWQDNDGNKRTSWEVQVDNIYFAGAKKQEGTQNFAPVGAPVPVSVDEGRSQLDEMGSRFDNVRFVETADDGELPF